MVGMGLMFERTLFVSGSCLCGPWWPQTGNRFKISDSSTGICSVQEALEKRTILEQKVTVGSKRPGVPISVRKGLVLLWGP